MRVILSMRVFLLVALALPGIASARQKSTAPQNSSAQKPLPAKGPGPEQHFDYDLLIRNGHVVDGTGNPWTSDDIGVSGDRIAFVGHADPGVTARRTIDASGLIVAPGFIDMLGQSEMSLLIDRQAVSKITQGITTEITGEGGSIAPLNDKQIADAKPFTSHYGITIDWHTLDEYLRRLEDQHPAINLATYVGEAQIREFVLGDDDRAPTPAELKQMEEMVGDAMDDGAFGLSTALIYAPGSYAHTDEIIALARRAAKAGGIYATHMRNEGDTESAALDEAIRIGREANIPVEIFHLKAGGKQNWGKMRQVLDKIEAARASGVDVTADLYPYLAAATSLGASIPPKYHEGGTEKFMERLRDPAQRAAIKADLQQRGDTPWEKLWVGSGGADGVLILGVLNPELKPFEGKTIAQIAKMQNKDVYDTLMDIVLADKDNTGAAYFFMSEDDLRLALQQPFVSVGTDFGEVSPTGKLSEGRAHPRAYGSFPRILGHYVRDEHLLGLEDAVRKMTSLAAQRVGLTQRGLLRQDYFADVTIFDPATIAEVATYDDPNRMSKGVRYVVVNGTVEIDDGRITGDTGGRPLRGPGYYNRGVSPEGLRPKAKIEGVITSPDGWPLPRTDITLEDPQGNGLATGHSGRDGHYEIVYEQACVDCKLAAKRMGFASQQRTVTFNGENPLWFSFTLATVGK